MASEAEGILCKLRLLVVLILSCAGGCAILHQASPVPNRQPAADLGIQCESVRVTGSLVATRVCTSKAQRDAIQESTRDAREFLDKQVIGACPGTPGC
jgi:hypothetical protein